MVDNEIEADPAKGQKGFLAFDVPLTSYEKERTLWIVSDSAMSGTPTTFSLRVSSDRIIVVLCNKETNGLITPIKGFRLAPEETEFLLNIPEKEKWDYAVITKENSGFTVLITEKDKLASLMGSINDEGTRESIRTPADCEMLNFLRKEDAGKVEKVTSRYMI
jgi:hypothetical protein